MQADESAFGSEVQSAAVPINHNEKENDLSAPHANTVFIHNIEVEQ